MNSFELHATLAGGETGQSRVEHAELEVDGDLRKCKTKVTSIQISRIVVLLLQWKLRGQTVFDIKDPIWRKYHDALRHAEPNWLKAVFGSRERLSKLIPGAVDSRIVVGNAFEKESVSISLTVGEKVLSSGEALGELWQRLCPHRDELSPSERDFAVQIAGGTLRLANMAEEKQVIAGTLFWLSRLNDLDSVLKNELLDPDGLFRVLIDELPDAPGGTERDAVLEWCGKVHQIIHFLRCQYARYAEAAGFPIADVVNLLRQVQSAAVRLKDAYNAKGVTADGIKGAERELGRTAEEVLGSLQKLQPELVGCVERCRRQVEGLYR